MQHTTNGCDGSEKIDIVDFGKVNGLHLDEYSIVWTSSWKKKGIQEKIRGLEMSCFACFMLQDEELACIAAARHQSFPKYLQTSYWSAYTSREVYPMPSLKTGKRTR